MFKLSIDSYNESEILQDIEEYIETTYNQHYVGSTGIQVNDLLMSLGHAESSYISNAIEYLARYGKKDGRNQKDLYKAVHNIIFLINLNHNKLSPEQNKNQLLTECEDVTDEI
jgi:hypothetical protein